MTASTGPAAGRDRRPTIVLVHGAFADGSSWGAVVERLHQQGYTVVAPANPLRGIDHDSAYLGSVVDAIEGPVLLVGHSYAGALITEVGRTASHAVGLVYVCAFAPDEDEKLGDVTAESKDAILMAALVPRGYPNGTAEPAIEFVCDPARFHETFAADLPAAQAAVLAATQRPVAATAFSDQAGAPAWKTLPAWAVVATADRAAGTDIVRTMARRAGAEIVEIDGSHLVMLSQPDAVTDVIVRAARATAPA